MCKAMEDLRNESYAEGMAQGIAQQKDSDIRSFLLMYHDVDNASKLFGVPVDTVRGIAKQL